MIHATLKGGRLITKNRNEYYKKRRESYKTFSCLLDREYLENFEQLLNELEKTKVQWLQEKIDEEFEKKKSKEKK